MRPGSKYYFGFWIADCGLGAHGTAGGRKRPGGSLRGNQRVPFERNPRPRSRPNPKSAISDFGLRIADWGAPGMAGGRKRPGGSLRGNQRVPFERNPRPRSRPNPKSPIPNPQSEIRNPKFSHYATAKRGLTSRCAATKTSSESAFPPASMTCFRTALVASSAELQSRLR
jgi:hypothetical protein